jgi:transmembrane sensor
LKSKTEKKSIILRYIAGSASVEEKKIVEDWVESDPLNHELIRDLQKIWNLTPQENFSVDVDAAWIKFQERKKALVRAKFNSAGIESKRINRYKSRVGFYKMTAAILVIALAGLFAYSVSQNNFIQEISSEQNGFYKLKKMETDRGEKARVRFSDGTEVMLNSASQLQFPQEFNGNKREVYLDGEAFFKVTYNENNPFLVHVQDAVVEVLGTEFNIRGWSEDDEVQVVVSDGKVSVSSSFENLEEREKVILVKGTKTQIARGQNPKPAMETDVLYHLLWTSGGIHFKNTPFKQAVQELERRFDLNITIAEKKLYDIPFTGTFQYAELNEILTVISASMDIGFTREAKNIVFFITE